MENQAIETALKAIEDQIKAIRSALGQEASQDQGNPMVTPEKPAGMGGNSPFKWMFKGMQLG